MRAQLQRAVCGLVASLLLWSSSAAGEPAPAESKPAAAAAPPRAAQEGPPTWFGQALATTDSGLNVTYFWSKGSKLRAETVVLGHKVVTIVNGDRYQSYDGLGRVGIDLGRAKSAIAADRRRLRPFGNELERLLAQGAEKVAEETLQGLPCEVYRITDQRGRREVWALKSESRLPVRVVVFDRSRGARVQTDYIDWQRDLFIDDAFFTPEAGIAFERMSFDEYSKLASEGKAVGSVPILYVDLVAGED